MQINGLPDDKRVTLLGIYEDKKVSIVIRLQTGEEELDAELWSKEIKSSLRPTEEYSTDDVMETYGHKIEKYRERSQMKRYEDWIAYFAGHLDDIDKAKEILRQSGLI